MTKSIFLTIIISALTLGSAEAKGKGHKGGRKGHHHGNIEKKFAKLDADKDGNVTLAEFQAAKAAHQAKTTPKAGKKGNKAGKKTGKKGGRKQKKN